MSPDRNSAQIDIRRFRDLFHIVSCRGTHATDVRSPWDTRRLKNDRIAHKLPSINIERIAELLALPLFHMQSQLPDTGRICL